MFTWRLDGYRTLARLTSGSPHRLTPRALSPRLLAVALRLLAPLLAIAAEIKVLSAGAIREPLKELAAQFERATSHKVTIVYGTAGTLRALLEKGESADLLMDAAPGM